MYETILPLVISGEYNLPLGDGFFKHYLQYYLWVPQSDEYQLKGSEAAKIRLSMEYLNRKYGQVFCMMVDPSIKELM